MNSFMAEAIRLARNGLRRGAGGPFGAVVVRDGVIIGRGWNRVVQTHDPTAHAEVVAIRHACATLGHFHLQGCELYTSCEPCPMCLAAIYWARLDRVRYANSRRDAAAIGFADADIYAEFAKPKRRRTIPCLHLRSAPAKALFADWLRDPHRVEY